jgi:hypothetical protein
VQKILIASQRGSLKHVIRPAGYVEILNIKQLKLSSIVKDISKTTPRQIAVLEIGVNFIALKLDVGFDFHEDKILSGFEIFRNAIRSDFNLRVQEQVLSPKFSCRDKPNSYVSALENVQSSNKNFECFRRPLLSK